MPPTDIKVDLSLKIPGESNGSFVLNLGRNVLMEEKKKKKQSVHSPGFL